MKWYLGIDVSKGYADFALLSELLVQQEETFQLDDTKSGHEQLKIWLEALFKRHPSLELDCGLESTGGFENNWYALLIKLSSSLPVRATRLNPSVRMSKQGRPAMRALLFMCANSAVRCDEHMRTIYARHRTNGKNHTQTLGVIMHKMVRVIWGVLTNEKPYESNIDLANQAKNNQNPVKDELKETENKRRMQKFDSEAPISRIATKKRRVHATSQVGEAELIRDLEHEPR